MDLPAHPTAPQKHPQYSLGLTLIAGCDEIFQARLQIYPRTTLWVLHEALERGCGYSDHSDLTALCKTASLQDDRRLLQIIEQKAKLFDVVLLLYSKLIH